MMGIAKETINKIKVMFESGYTCAEIAKLLDIPDGIIRHVVNR